MTFDLLRSKRTMRDGDAALHASRPGIGVKKIATVALHINFIATRGCRLAWFAMPEAYGGVPDLA